MSDHFPQIYVARHGETEWSLSGQHTGRTDLPLTPRGEEEARQLGKRLAGITFDEVWSSPLQRARHTCELAGFAAHVKLQPVLLEVNYGDYEGKTSAEIKQMRPDWDIFRDGCPGGEAPEEYSARGDEIVKMLRAFQGSKLLLFAHKHILQVLVARWCRLPVEAGKVFYLDTAALSILGYAHNLDDPAVRLWNDHA